MDAHARLPRRAQGRPRRSRSRLGSPPCAAGGTTRPISFSLFYFAAGEDAAADGYRLLLESARFADRNGFEAVWTPERHFHAFGGAYPNPSVTGAALAAITEQRRHPCRQRGAAAALPDPRRRGVGGRRQPLARAGRRSRSPPAGSRTTSCSIPSAYADGQGGPAAQHRARAAALARRDRRAARATTAQPVDVRTLPRPVQAELPVWLTSAGTPATFERAGTLGVNVLTHLLGQSVAAARREHRALPQRVARGRPRRRGPRHADAAHLPRPRRRQRARGRARADEGATCGTAVGLLRDVASAFPTFAGRRQGRRRPVRVAVRRRARPAARDGGAALPRARAGCSARRTTSAAIVEALAAVGRRRGGLPHRLRRRAPTTCSPRSTCCSRRSSTVDARRDVERRRSPLRRQRGRARPRGTR